MLNNGSIIEGTYQIICRVDESDNRSVYRARHLKKQSDVIMRKLSNCMVEMKTDSLAVEYLTAMYHPCLPVIYDVVTVDGDIYSIEEEKRGVSLDSYIAQNGALPYAKAYQIMSRLIDALSYLHGQDIPLIHGNVLPQNILLDTASEAVYLINMDVAKAVGLAGYQPSHAVNNGFFAPEQYLAVYENATVTISAATDIYCLGSVMYHILTGYAPDIRYDRIIPIQSLRLNCEEGMVKTIGKMMAYQPEDRYADAMELRIAVDGSYKLDKRYRRMKRHRRANMLLATGLILLGTGLILGGLYKNKSDDEIAYNSRLTVVDECMVREAYYDARDLLLDLEDDYPQNLDLYKREIACMYRARDYEDCINRAQAILKDHFPKELVEGDFRNAGDFYHILAQAYYKEEKYEDAQEAIETALEYYDEDYRYYRDYSLILIDLGKVDKAEGELGVSKDLGWDAMEYTYVEARIAYESEAYAAATEKYLKVIEEAENDEIKQEAYLSCAIAYDSMCDYKNETAVLEQALSDYPQEDTYRRQLAKAYLSWGDDDAYAAEEHYSQSLALYQQLAVDYPEDYDIQDHIVILYRNLERSSEAEELLLSIEDRFRDQYRVYMWLSYMEDEKQQQLKKKKRDYSLMQKYYDKARKLYSSSQKDYDMEDLEERMEVLKEKDLLK